MPAKMLVINDNPELAKEVIEAFIGRRLPGYSTLPQKQVLYFYRKTREVCWSDLPYASIQPERKYLLSELACTNCLTT